jgi:hypothetical protein
MERNIGTVDAWIRITCGLTGLAWSTAKMSRRCWSPIPLSIAMISAMKVAEGVTRFCPLITLCEADKE